MNILIFHNFLGINVGNSIGPAPFAPLGFSSGGSTPVVIQGTTLQAIGSDQA